MKKRVFSLFLALVMVLGMLPMTALAAVGDTVKLTVYRNPEKDPAGISFSVSNIAEFVTRDTTATNWEEEILAAARATGYSVPNGSYAEYYVSSNDMGWVGIADSLIGVNYANYFGWNSVNVGADTESRVRILDRNGTEIVGDTIGDLVVTVKSNVTVTWSVSGTTSYTDTIALENALSSAANYKIATDAAKAYADKSDDDAGTKEDDGISYKFLGWDADGDGVYSANDDTVLATLIDVTDRYTETNWYGQTTVDEPRVPAASVDGVSIKAIYDTYYTITWNPNGGTWSDGTTAAKTTTVKKGDTPVAPETLAAPAGNAQYSGYEFGGWGNIVAATEAATYTASWNGTGGKTYTITFVDEYGNVLEEKDYAYGATPVAPNTDKAFDAQYTYEFSGWDKDIVAVTCKTTYTANYTETLREYTITWKVGEGTWADGTTVDETTTVKYGETPVAPKTPSKDEDANYTYTFGGWDSELVALTDADKDGKIDNATTYKATYTATEKGEVTITYMVDGNVYTTETKTEGSVFAAPTAPTKLHYTFDAWYTDAGVKYDFSAAVDTSITLHAGWTENIKYTVSFYNDANDNDTLEKSELLKTQTVYKDCTCDDCKVVEPAGPSKTGWTFVCWKLNDAEYDFSSKVTADITLVAYFSQNTYDVEYYDGDKLVKTETAAEGKIVELASYDKPDYVLLGWAATKADAAAGKVKYNVSDEVSAATTVYAVWGEDVNNSNIEDKHELVTFNVDIVGNGSLTISSTGATVYGSTDRTLTVTEDGIYEFLTDGLGNKEWIFTTTAGEGFELESFDYESGEPVYLGSGSELNLTAIFVSKTAIVLGDEDKTVEVTYGSGFTSDDLLAALAPVVNDGLGNELSGAKAYIVEDITKNNVGTYPVTLKYDGKDEYLASETTATVVINKAVANISVASQTVKYGGAVADPFQSNCKTIDFIAGVDAHNASYVVGSVQVKVPSEMQILLAFAAAGAGVKNIEDMTIDEVKALLAAAKNSGMLDENLQAAVDELAKYEETLEKLVAALEKIQAELPIDTELKIGVVATIEMPKDVGVYVVGSILADDNYAAASDAESMDAGYLIITPDGVKAELAWDENDPNYIVTLGKAEEFKLTATATVTGTNDSGVNIGRAQNQVDYLFVGVNDDGELVINRVLANSGEDMNAIINEVGVYAQVAYIADWGNVMYYAMPIARPVIVSPDVAKVEILDANGNPNYAQVYTYTGEPIDVTVTVDGQKNVSGLKYKFIGSDTTVDGWYRSEAPTDAGVYTIVAVYTEKDAEGDISKAGGAIGAIIIEPADSEYALVDTQVCPDGKEHFADITDPLGQDEVTIAIDRDNNIAYVNLPADTKAHAQRIVSMLPAEVETKVVELLSKYAEFDGNVSASTVKAELNDIIDKVIAVDMTGEAAALAEQVVEKLKTELENSEDIKALAAKIEAEVKALEEKLRSEIPDEYEQKLEDYIRDIVTVTEDNVDIDTDKVKEDIYGIIDELKAEGGLPLAVAGVLYKVADELVYALENNATVAEMTDKVEEIIAELKALELSDAEKIAKTMLETIAGKVDTTELKALLKEVVDKFEALGYVEYAKDMLSKMAEMYPVNVNVDSYVTAVETELDALVAKVKEKVASGDLQKDDLKAIEEYVDNVLEELKTLVDKIPDCTIIFGHNPKDEGKYDCYAMNISANYKPEFVSATLTIGHTPVTDDAVDPTCTKTGLTEGSHCDVCGVTLVAQETVKELGHVYDDGQVTTAPDCDDAGVKTYTCQRAGCGHTYTEAINPDGHTEVTVDAVAPTCTETGLTAGTKCSVCGVVIVAQKTVPVTGHAWGEWVTVKQPTYTETGLMQRVCANDSSHVETRMIAKLVYYVPVISTPTVTVKGLNTTDHVAYIIGVGGDKVNPLGTITRAEVATIYFRLMNDDFRAKYWSNTNSYADVADDAWYNVAVSTLEAAGVIKDTVTGGEFRPNDPITRAELAVMAAQFANVTGTIPTTSFKDVSRTYWAAKEISIVEYAGWIEGYAGNFRPDDNLTRAECMTIVNRMLKRGAEAENMLEDMITFEDNVYGTWYYEAVQEATNSHTYTRTTQILTGEKFRGEKWIKIEEAPDWAALEKAWAEADEG